MVVSNMVSLVEIHDLCQVDLVISCVSRLLLLLVLLLDIILLRFAILLILHVLVMLVQKFGQVRIFLT